MAPATTAKSPARNENPPANKPTNTRLQLTAIGEVIGYNTVIVKSRVDGPIVQIAFHEGEEVNEGDLLAVIDPGTYRVALNEALASRDMDSAELNQAKSNLEREKALYDDGIIAKQEFEKQEANFYHLEAAVRADQAKVDRASLDLSYTRIVAPHEGRVGFKTVDVGNTVHSSDANGIVTITQIRPTTVVFSIPPDRLNQILRSMRQHAVRVEAFDENGKTLLGTGEVLTADTTIDSATGCAKVKALFSNRNQLLWPNEFVQIKIEIEPGTSQIGNADGLPAAH